MVVAALDELLLTSIDDADLFAAAIERVKTARSAGVERIGATGFLGRNSASEIQLNYRAEMADVFMDLAIDLGIRHSTSSQPTGTVV